jgi:hypothetical protein
MWIVRRKIYHLLVLVPIPIYFSVVINGEGRLYRSIDNPKLLLHFPRHEVDRKASLRLVIRGAHPLLRARQPAALSAARRAVGHRSRQARHLHQRWARCR